MPYGFSFGKGPCGWGCFFRGLTSRHNSKPGFGSNAYLGTVRSDPWAAFTREENHGLGAIFYPAVGLVAVVFSIALVIAFRRDKTRGELRGLPVYLAAVCVVVWASITRAVLVPAMFRLRDLGGNAIELERLFHTVVRWSAINDVLHMVTFGLNLWPLIAIFSIPNAEFVSPRAGQRLSS